MLRHIFWNLGIGFPAARDTSVGWGRRYLNQKAGRELKISGAKPTSISKLTRR